MLLFYFLHGLHHFFTQRHEEKYKSRPGYSGGFLILFILYGSFRLCVKTLLQIVINLLHIFILLQVIYQF
jgi:hypothetical protein